MTVKFIVNHILGEFPWERAGLAHRDYYTGNMELFLCLLFSVGLQRHLLVVAVNNKRCCAFT